MISGGHFSHDVFSSFLAVFLPLLIAKFSLSLAMAGAFTVVFRIPSLLNPLMGIVSDRINLFRLAIWAPAITAMCFSLLGLMPSYALVCGLLLVAGLSACLFHVVGPVMIARAAHGNIGRGMSFWMTGGETARTVGPLLGVWVVSMWGFHGSYPVMILGILASLFLYTQLRHTDLGLAPRTNDSLRQAWRDLHRMLLPLAGIMAACAFMSSTLAAFLPTYMVNSGKSLWLGGAALAVLEGAGTVGTLVGGTLSDRLGRRVVLAIAIPLASLLMLGFIYAPGWLAMPLLVLLGLTLFATTPVELAIVQDHCMNRRGTANGLFMGISFIIMGGVTVLVGWLADRFGMTAAFTISALMGLAGVPAIWLLPARRDAHDTVAVCELGH